MNAIEKLIDKIFFKEKKEKIIKPQMDFSKHFVMSNRDSEINNSSKGGSSGYELNKISPEGYWDANFNSALIQRYTDLGVSADKIQITYTPSFFWSLSRKCMVGSYAQPNTLEVITNPDGTKEISGKNNVRVIVRSYAVLSAKDVTKINNSNGIIIMYDSVNYRFAYVPDYKDYEPF